MKYPQIICLLRDIEKDAGATEEVMEVLESGKVPDDTARDVLKNHLDEIFAKVLDVYKAAGIEVTAPVATAFLGDRDVGGVAKVSCPAHPPCEEDPK